MTLAALVIQRISELKAEKDRTQKTTVIMEGAGRIEIGRLLGARCDGLIRDYERMIIRG